MTTLPLIVLIDLDHTIIGDAALQFCRYELCKATGTKHDISNLMFDLQNGLLRPHFESFIKLLKTKYQYSEVYVYTAADKNWANFLVNAVEKYTNIKFNRPIFTREYCINDNGLLKKQIGKLAPTIYRKIKQKYNLSHISQIKKQFVMIDNNMVMTESDMHRFVKCPSYEYIVPCDVLSGIPSKRIKEHLEVIIKCTARYMGSQGLLPSNDPHKFLIAYYTKLADIYKSTGALHIKNMKEADKFWLTIEKILRNHTLKSFNSKVVAYINKNVQK
jgi:hypothetical protein